VRLGHAKPKSRGIPPGLPRTRKQGATREVAMGKRNERDAELADRYMQLYPARFDPASGQLRIRKLKRKPLLKQLRNLAPTKAQLQQLEHESRLDRDQRKSGAQVVPLSGTATQRDLRRQQAARRREVLTKQAEDRLARQQPRILRHMGDFWHADRLAIRKKDEELRRFLQERAKREGVGQALAKEGVRHWMKFFRRYKGRGRPRGTGHPKVKIEDLLGEFGFRLADITKLRKAGLNDRDLKVLYAYMRKGSQKAAAKEFGTTPQAVNNRFRDRIKPALRKVNAKFSPQFLRDVSAETSTPLHSK